MTRIELKMLHSNELRALRDNIKKELDFRADVGSEIENKEKWLGADEWSKEVQEQRKEEREREGDRIANYIDESSLH
tara:strand:+ start:1105 stop:1335 length:231 start_codon:yes stop_codon:yes gene_type:complete